MAKIYTDRERQYHRRCDMLLKALRLIGIAAVVAVVIVVVI